MSAYSDIVQRYQDRLWETPTVIDWLADRGLSTGTIMDNSLGWTGRNGGTFHNSITIPYYGGTGKLVTLRYRSLEPNAAAKYRDQLGERSHLYNVGSVRSHRVYLTEGEFDAMVLMQEGFAAVGIPGINRFGEEWRWLFAGNEVLIVFDSERPGTDAYKHVHNARGKIKRALEKVAERVDYVDLPPGEDVSSLYVKDREGLLACLGQQN